MANISLGIGVRLFAGVGIVLILLAATTIISYDNSRELIESANWIVHTEEVKVTLEEILVRLIDAETGQRGFIITGEEHYLEPYNIALLEIDGKIEYLRELTGDNPVQQKNIGMLEPMIDDKFDELQETIGLIRVGDIDGATAVVISDRGKGIMDSIRILLSDMGAEENKLLLERSQKPEDQRRRTDTLLVTLLVAGILLGIGIAFFTARSISKPIKKLTQDVSAITKGKLDVRLGKSSISEIQSLTDSLDRVLASMKLAILRTGAKKEDIGLGKAPTVKNDAGAKYKKIEEVKDKKRG